MGIADRTLDLDSFRAGKKKFTAHPASFEEFARWERARTLFGGFGPYVRKLEQALKDQEQGGFPWIILQQQQGGQADE